jgi:hypothetical protein
MAAFLLASAAGAAQGADDSARWYLRVDNDFFFNTDRWYSSGVRVARVRDGWELGVAQEIYTPEAKHPNLVDRAPAGRLFASVAKHDAGDDFLQTLEVDAGVRGPSALGEQTTRAIHEVVHAPHVDWSRQLPDAFDGSVIVARTQSIPGVPLRAHFGATLGTQVTFIHAGLEARFGDARAPSSALLRFAATPPFADGARGWSYYAGASARAVARNELLDVGYREGEPAPTMRSTVTRIAGGLAWSGSWGSLTFDLVQESREFVEQRVAQRFGSIAVHATF